MSVTPDESAPKTEAVIFCEGYYDRAFWAGLLLRLGVTDPGIRPDKRARQVVRDPWGDVVARGEFAFLSRSSRFIRITPCGGKVRILGEVVNRLRERDTHAVGRIVVNADADVAVGAQGLPAGPNRETLQRELSTVDPQVARVADDMWTSLGTTVHLVPWSAPDPPAPFLPDKQCLERIICAAIVGAYPDRGSHVAQWLQTIAADGGGDPKQHLWSHMAGWFAEHGCEDFIRRLWNDGPIGSALEARLRESGIWQVAEALAGESVAIMRRV